MGDVKIVQLNYSQYSSRYEAFKQGQIAPVFDPKKAGGALMDLNVYNIHFVAGLFGEPKAVHYYPNMKKGVDTSVFWFWNIRRSSVSALPPRTAARRCR